MKGFDKYLREANHNLQIANNMDELKSYVACILYDNDKKDKEIESLNKELEEYKKDFKEANDLALKLITNNQEYVCKSIKDTIDILIEKLQQKENIIKEVREYIKSHSNNCMFELRIEEMEELLQILDKENK